MELFSEIYSCYYCVAAKVLSLAQSKPGGISASEIEACIEDNAFYDSAFHLMPKLSTDEWALLEKNNGRYFAKTRPVRPIPLTTLQKSWLKALLADKKIKLFLTPNQLDKLHKDLADTDPLFIPEDFHTFDSASDGDPFDNDIYIYHFRKILDSLKNKQPLYIEYHGGKGGQIHGVFQPWRLNFSPRDEKFRLVSVKIDTEPKRVFIINLSRIKLVRLTETTPLPAEEIAHCIRDSQNRHTLILQIKNERNALERCMLQFASMEKETEYDEADGSYICRLQYDIQDEAELIIRILSFGPVVKVIGPQSILSEVKRRLKRQIALMQ